MYARSKEYSGHFHNHAVAAEDKFAHENQWSIYV